MRSLARIVTGRWGKWLIVVVWLVLLAIRAARLVRLPLGVTEDNLRGLRRARHVDSSADLERLGIALRPLEATLRDQR